MGKINTSIVNRMKKNSAFKKKVNAVVLNYLKQNPDEIPDFFEGLSTQLIATPEKYISMINKMVSAKEKYKFAPDEEDKYKWIQNMNINTVLDVGAWKGDSARQFSELFPTAKIFSFEPLRDCFERLQALEKNIQNLKTFNFALGDKADKLKINRSGFSPSSSLLKMKDTHKEAFPFSAEETIEEIEVRTLDSVTSGLDLSPNVLLKIDVQGFEENVLKGAFETLKKVKIIVIELSFVELYAGQPMFDKIYNILKDHGFVYSGSWQQLLNPKDGAIWQQNGVFISKRPF
ncbi:hypothetical protein BH09BAC5_BH09BAC5_27870 [soil metagenome]